MWIPGIWLRLSGLRHGGASTFTDRTISAALLQDLSEVRRGKDKTVSLEDFCLISNCEKASNITRPVILYGGQCDIHWKSDLCPYLIFFLCPLYLLPLHGPAITPNFSTHTRSQRPLLKNASTQIGLSFQYDSLRVQANPMF